MVAKARILKPETFKPADGTKEEQRRFGWRELGAAGIHLMAGCRCTALQSDVNVLLEILMPLTSRCLLEGQGEEAKQQPRQRSLRDSTEIIAESQLEEATALLRTRTKSEKAPLSSQGAKAPPASQRWWPSPSDLSTALVTSKHRYAMYMNEYQCILSLQSSPQGSKACLGLWGLLLIQSLG